MHRSYEDILAFAAKNGDEVLWWDEHAVPRFSEFDWWGTGVYEKYAVLYEIACQSCRRKFNVLTSWSDHELQWYEVPNKYSAKGTSRVGVESIAFVPEGIITDSGTWTIEDLVEDLHYGDPPAHGCIGDTMNSVPLKIIKVLRRADFGERDAEGNFLSSKEVPELVGKRLVPDWALNADGTCSYE